MFEADFDVNVGRTRRLPSWMSRTAAIVEIETTEVTNADEQSYPPEAPRPKNANNKGILCSEETTLETKNGNRKRKKTDEDASTSFGFPRQTRLSKKELKSKNGGKVGKRKMLLENGKIKGTEDFQEFGNLDSVDAKIVLTVEDLISIAKEYVDADAKKSGGQNKTESTTVVDDSRRKAMPSNSLISMKRNLKTYPGSTDQKIFESPEKTLAPCSSKAREEEDKEPESFTIDATRTGDVKQDMLNLFLGPLLQKPVPREMKYDDSFPVEPLNRFTSEEAALKVIEIPAEKRKCSLKDKVSMFLD